jgi:hypothetical protein
MENDEVVESFFQAIEKKDYSKVESLVTINFKAIGIGTEPLGIKEFLVMNRAYKTGMPDYKFNYKIGSVSQNIVEAKVRPTGTHSKDMPSPIPGLNNIPATNRSLNLPEDKVRFTIKDNKIERIQLEEIPGGRIARILKQLGVEIPTEIHH